MQRTVARWQIEHDPEATRRCFALLPVGTGCTCNECRNFDAAAGRIFPAEFIALVDALGVDPTKPSEVWGIAHKEPSGLYFISGWFHFVGSIVAGEDGWQWQGGRGVSRPEELLPGLKIWLSSRLALVPEAFTGLPLVQLEFATTIPWVLSEPGPDA